MISDDYYYTSKKSDDICPDVCGQQDSPTTLSMSRLRCMLRGLDLKTIIFLLVVVPMIVVGVYLHGQKITYFFHPLWQSPLKPFIKITHYYHENVPMGNICKLHGWGIREYPRRVFDAVLFSNEVDMLKIRWKELYPYITQFVLLESNSTFTGLPKLHNFAINRDQFKFIEPRLTYGNIPGRARKGENPFVEEAYQRVALDQLLKLAGVEDDDLLIMSDVDEIPGAHTINLLRWCDDIPHVLHLHLRNYLYSFEFQIKHRSWRASVHRYESGKTRYAHYRQSDYLLADAGWHCSFCFRYIGDFIFKMKAYSHNDRVRFLHYLNPTRIQDVICKGDDLYDMLPEEYTFKDIIGSMGPIPHSYSAVTSFLSVRKSRQVQISFAWELRKRKGLSLRTELGTLLNTGGDAQGQILRCALRGSNQISGNRGLPVLDMVKPCVQKGQREGFFRDTGTFICQDEDLFRGGGHEVLR